MGEEVGASWRCLCSPVGAVLKLPVLIYDYEYLKHTH